ncbi:MAG: hypothetical protein ACSW8D_15520 [Prevotella sp.]
MPYIKGNAQAQARAFRLDFGDGEQTGISTTDFTDYTDKAGAWYTLDGRRLAGKPTSKKAFAFSNHLSLLTLNRAKLSFFS